MKTTEMAIIRISFLIDLRDYENDYFKEFYGPAFHRFLPNNKPDKIDRKLVSFEGLISFWFEKRGILTNHYIKYDTEKKLINEDIIPKQAILDAGPLLGEVTINKLSSKLIQVLEDNRTGNLEYVSFAKKLVKEIIKYSNDLINIFRYVYKQYWLKNVDIWDSRSQSLGSFCQRSLSMQYSLDNGKTWNKFLPDKERHVVYLKAKISHDYSDYISYNDWSDIKLLYKNDFQPSITSVFLTQANSTYNKGDLKKAFIETVTALEMALEQVINKNTKITKLIFKSVQSISSIPRVIQFSLIALQCDSINSTEIEKSLKAIEIRNRIVHDGYNPKETESKYLKSLLISISKIIKEPVIKYPSLNRGNTIMSIESWEKATKKIKGQLQQRR